MNEIDNFIKEIALKHDLRLSETRDIIDSLFRTIRNTIESDNYESIKVKHLGKFIPNGRGKRFKNKLNEISKETKTDN